jgi:hypothetical protein
VHNVPGQSQWAGKPEVRITIEGWEEMNALFTVAEDSKGTCCLIVETSQADANAVVILTLKNGSYENAHTLAAHLNDQVRGIKVETIKSD